MHAALYSKIKIFGGKQWRPLVHVRDAASAFLRVIEAEEKKVKGQIFNIGDNNQNFQIGTLGQLVMDIYPEIDKEHIPQSPDLRDYHVNFDKIRSLGYKTRWEVSDGIIEIYNAIKSGVIKNPLEKRYYNA